MGCPVGISHFYFIMKVFTENFIMTPLKWFYSFLKKYKLSILSGLLLTTIVSILALVTPYISGQIVDIVIGGQKYNLLGIMIFILIASTLSRGLFRAKFLMIFETTSQNVIYDMRDYVYRRFLKEDFSFYDRNRTGDLMARQTGDMEAIRKFVAQTLYFSYENILLFLLALIMIFTVNIKLALAMLAILPFTAFTTFMQFKQVKTKFGNIRKQFASLNSFVSENISGNRVVKAFAKEDYEIEKFTVENEAYMNAELQAAKMWSIFIPIFEFLSNALVVILMIAGGIMAVKGTITLGNMLTVNGYLWMLNNPLKQAGWIVNDLQHMITSVERVYNTVCEEPDIKSPDNPVNKTKLNGEIEFKNVSYQDTESDIISNISFKAHPGQNIGIIGATGSGKSTIMNLLCRFYDVTDGEILIDGINIKNMDLYNLRNNIGMAMQDVFLFSDTIAANISFGQPDSSFDDIVRVAKIANAHDFILETPDGYDTIVGERGMGLSGGQKQRISLARALLKQPSIIILDDTTSAVDMKTENLIQEELKSLKDSTVFIIAHRISSIKDADLILVLDEGRIIEHGTHDELLEKESYYSTVFKHQYGNFRNSIL